MWGLRRNCVRNERRLTCVRPARVDIGDLRLHNNEVPIRTNALPVACLKNQKTMGEVTMLTITDAAFSRLQDMLQRHPAQVAARLTRKGDRVRVCPGKQRPGDKVVEYDGRIVLLLDKSMAERLEGRILDVRKTEEGPKLGLRRDRRDATSN